MTQVSDPMHNTDDVVTFLKQQHEQIRDLFTRVMVVSGAAREEAFLALRRLMAIHETAEEEVVHPRARHELVDGEALVASRLEEEHHAKQALAELETLNVDSAEFESKFRQLRADVLAHAEAEEREEFARLKALLDDGQLNRMRKVVELAEMFAPTRPHPGVESAMGNLLVGPFAMMLDRARDAIVGKG